MSIAAEPLTIAALRAELGLTLEQFAEKVGLQSRGRMSVIEREQRCPVHVALRIEELSGGRIDAGELNEDVKASRHALLDSAGAAAVSAGKSGGNSRLSDQGVA